MRRHRYTPTVHSYAGTSRLAQPSHRTAPLSSSLATPTRSHVSDTVEDAQDSGDVYLCLNIKKGKIGCAVFEARSGKLTLMDDTIEEQDAMKIGIHQNMRHDSATSDGSDEIENDWHQQSDGLLSTILRRFRPDLIFVNASTPLATQQMLKKQAVTSGAVLQIRPAKEFNTTKGHALLQSSSVETADFSQGRRDNSQSLYLGKDSQLDSNPTTMAAVHVLLTHLQQHAALQNDNDTDQEPSPFTIITVEMVTLDDTMHLGADTLKALCIFDEEAHVTPFASAGKEGLSLYSLLDHVQTPMGRVLLRQWLSAPSLSLSVLQARHDAIDLFTRKASSMEMLRREMKSMKNMSTLAIKIIEGKADTIVWHAIWEFTAKCLMIRAHCNNLQESNREVSIVDTVLMMFSIDQLQHIRRAIGDTIDWTESRIAQRVTVQTGVDAQLDEWRYAHANLPSILATIASRIREELGSDLDDAYDMTLEYFPQVGYLQALCYRDGSPADRDSIQMGQELGWTYQYSSEVKAFFKTNESRRLDGQIGDLHSFIAGREIEIVQRLYQTVSNHLGWLLKCSNTIAELDCLLSFAFAALKHGYTRPTLEEGAILDIREGRHPLQELIVETFVPNDTALEGGKGESTQEEQDEEGSLNSVLIVTGANACGKTIYLKQIALIVYMAQIGSFVPAKSAIIGLVDKIFTRLQASDSINTSHSSFTSDMQQVSKALQSCTNRSLILLDEMGKGSNNIDGACLFAATVKHLLQRGEDCPKVIAATHFHEIFHDDFLPSTLKYTPAHMQILVGQDAADLDSNITFLYKLRYGLELTSHASQCELLCGIPEDIVKRASYIAQLSRDHNLQELRLRIADSLEVEDEDDMLSKAERVARAFVQWDIRADALTAFSSDDLEELDPFAKLEQILAL